MSDIRRSFRHFRALCRIFGGVSGTFGQINAIDSSRFGHRRLLRRPMCITPPAVDHSGVNWPAIPHRKLYAYTVVVARCTHFPAFCGLRPCRHACICSCGDGAADLAAYELYYMGAARGDGGHGQAELVLASGRTLNLACTKDGEIPSPLHGLAFCRRHAHKCMPTLLKSADLL